MNLPTTIIELLGWTVTIFALCFSFIKACQYFSKEISEAQRLKLDLQKQKSKEAVDLAAAQVEMIKAQVELAKHNALTAMQVADLISQIHTVKNDLETLKRDSAQKDAAFVKSIDNLEDLLTKLEDNFTKLLMMEASAQINIKKATIDQLNQNESI